MIDVKNLSFSYGSNAVLENISLRLEEGRIYGLLGENGVGKTTLLTLLCGLKKVQSGSIEVDGIDPYKRLPSSLQNQYYLPDEVMPYNATASNFAHFSGKFWPAFDMDKFIKIMKEFETDPEKKMTRCPPDSSRRPTSRSRWLAMSSISSWTSRPTASTSLQRLSSARL